MDILHPLATVDWEECPGCKLKSDTLLTSQAVAIRDAFYVATTDKIHATTTKLTSWTAHDPPEGLECFGLTSYYSQLLVVGGEERGKVTNKVWTSDNTTYWQSSLPPMPNKQRFPLAINTGPSPECVIVAGGEREDSTIITVVEVLLEEQWFTVPSTLVDPYNASFQNGIVIFFNSNEANEVNLIVYCRLQSLLAACVQSHDLSHDSIPEGSSSLQSTLWKSIRLPYKWNYPMYFGQRLTTNAYPDTRLYIFYPQRTNTACHTFSDENVASQPWVYAGDLPEAHSTVLVMTISTKEVFAIAADDDRMVHKVLKGSLRRCQYNVDDQFSISALHKLEAAGIPVLSSLAPLYKELASALKIPQAEIDKKKWMPFLFSLSGYRYHEKIQNTEMIELDIVIELWLSDKSPLLPTWRSLYETLRQLGLKELSQQIAEYLIGARSLKQLCLSVVTSALLEHRRSLEPDQLHVRLPNYVPPRDKQLITNKYKMSMTFTDC